MPEDTTLAADDPAQDTSAANPATADTSPPAAPEPQDAQPAAAPGTSADAPSTSTQQVQDPNAPPESKTPAPAEPDWRDRYRNLQSYADRRHQQYQQHLQQQQEELNKLRQQQEQAQLKPWAKQHPENAQFRGLLERSKAIHRQLQAVDQLPLEQRDAAKQAIMAGVTPEEQQHLGQYREAMQSFQNDFFNDPENTLAPIIQRNVQLAMQKLQADMAGEQQVARDFDAPHLKPILQDPKYAGYLNDKLAKGVPYEEAMELLKLRAATDLMYQRLNGAKRTAQHAQEQTRLVKGRAEGVVAPDASPAPADPYQLAKKEAAKLGIMPGTAAFNRLIDKYTQSPSA